jgi:hypothetical protein
MIEMFPPDYRGAKSYSRISSEFVGWEHQHFAGQCQTKQA